QIPPCHRQAHARPSVPGAGDGLHDRVVEPLHAEVLGEAEVAGAGGEALEVLVEAVDPGLVEGGGAAEHGLEEPDPVLEPGVEGGDAGVGLVEELAVEEDGGHGATLWAQKRPRAGASRVPRGAVGWWGTANP